MRHYAPIYIIVIKTPSFSRSLTTSASSKVRYRFMSFSDAAFASRERAHSQRGTFILATTSTIDDSKGSKVSPLVWRFKRIARVVSSTLASETYALSGALDQLSWVRLHWQWMRDPTTAWNKPDETLTKITLAYAVVDCKSLYDLQKTTIPRGMDWIRISTSACFLESSRSRLAVKRSPVVAFGILACNKLMSLQERSGRVLDAEDCSRTPEQKTFLKLVYCLGKDFISTTQSVVNVDAQNTVNTCWLGRLGTVLW